MNDGVAHLSPFQGVRNPLLNRDVCLPAEQAGSLIGIGVCPSHVPRAGEAAQKPAVFARKHPQKP